MNTEHTNQSTSPEPFGYFKAEPFGWTDCEESDEGAIALYDRPQAAPVARDVLMTLAEEVRETCWQVGSGDATIRELDLAAIVDRYAAQPPAVAGAVPEGCALVPIEPTAQMVEAGFGRDDDNCKFWLHPAQAYRAMLVAAQKGGAA